MNVVNKLLLMAIPLVFLVACGTTPPATETPSEPMATGQTEEEQAPEAVDQPEAAVVTPVETQQGFQGSPLDDPDSLLSKRVVYFDFDKSNVKDEFRDIIAAHAGYLAEHPSARVTLEGHADERGSREYNMGLGERRANAVRQFMLLQGAAARQIETVSYGEERPVAFGHDEASWALNRRVEIVYKSR
jgi:peptidoglycan-associated lipoprotein